MARTLAESEKDTSGGCRLHGVTVVLLCLSRACGVAPVTFERQRTAIFARVSRTYAYVAFVFALLMGLLVFVALVLDVSYEFEKDAHQRHELARLMANGINYLLTSITIIVSAATAPARMKRFLSYCMQIQQIHVSLENKPMSRSLEKLMRGLLVVSMAIVVVAVLTNTVTSTREVVFYHRRWLLHILQKLLYIGHIEATLLTLQMSFVVAQALWALKALNKSIARLETSMQRNGRSSDSTLVEKIRLQSATYASIVDVAYQINASEGLMMMLLLLDCTYRFISVAFFITLDIYSKDSSWISTHIAAQMTHFVRVCCAVLLLVEPCHRTHLELRKTQELISSALCALPSALTPGSVALARFHATTEPYRHVYTPMGIFKFSTSVYTALLGGLTTLIILIVRI